MTSTHRFLIALGVLLLIFVLVVWFLPPAGMSDTPGTGTGTSTPDGASGIETPTMPEGWLTYTDNQVTFSYPESLDTTYISTVEWPPRATVSDEPYACESGETATGMTRETEIDGRTFCVTTVGEGAAGSVYTEYAYLTELDSARTVRLDFTLRAVQCANYDEPEMSACTEEQDSFDIDQTIEQIVDTLRLN